MSKFVDVLMEERKEVIPEKEIAKKGYDWRYENSIIFEKKQIEVDGDYSQWRTNTVLCNHKDLIFYINSVNINHNISNKMHYDYLFRTIRKSKRYSKSETKEEKKAREKKEELINLLSDYYKYNNVRAKEVLKILTPEQIDIIRKRKEKGGLK